MPICGPDDPTPGALMPGALMPGEAMKGELPGFASGRTWGELPFGSVLCGGMFCDGGMFCELCLPGVL